MSEAENLALYVAKNYRELDIHYDAIYLLIDIYADLKHTDKALDMINMLTPMKYCREFALSNGIGDGKNKLYKQGSTPKIVKM